ncbi:MAG: hybrid sensor histidine kinase/response regulator [Deltaproteobacteria bacterium]|nr:hybrid sensor histidine kinase/response regulator [Deltaproteobacteria bacterium]
MTRVLLVEDNRGEARLFAELLTEVPHGQFVLTTVETLAQALAAVSAHDVVFLDLSLPDAHGLSTLTAMVGAAPSTPIVVLTGNDDDRVAVDAVKAGAQDYLRKAEITPSLIARTAWYAIERQKTVENARRLALADEAGRRARFISRVTAAISASLDLDVVLADVAKLLVPTLGDTCTIELETGETVGASEIDMTMIMVTPLIARGRRVGAIRFAMGKSGRLYDEDLRRLAEEIAERIALGIDNAQLYAAAQLAIRGRDELLAVVSHDLRNPLNVVTLALQMIEHDPDTLVAALPRAKRGVERMQRLIADLLDVAQIETGTLTVELRPVEVGGVLDDAFEQHRALATERQITLVRTYESPVGVAICDRHRIGQVLANLVGNALKFTPKGGTIRIGAEVVHDERVSIIISDTGRGIAPAHLDHIFDRYWQPERGSHGVGLGLAIVKGIVAAHGGEVLVESTLGAGTSFRIELRAGDASAMRTGEQPALARVGQ